MSRMKEMIRFIAAFGVVKAITNFFAGTLSDRIGRRMPLVISGYGLAALGKVLLALAYQAAGWNGVSVLTIAAIALMSFLLTWYFSREFKPLLATALTIVVAFLVSWNYNARPFIFTFLISFVSSARVWERVPTKWKR